MVVSTTNQSVYSAERLAPVREVGPVGTRANLRVRVESLWHRHYGKVYNDLHQGTVGYHIVPHAPYHSYIESKNIRIETDQEGHPVFVTVAQTGVATVDSVLTPPVEFDLNAIRFLDLRTRVEEPIVQYDRDRALMHIQFSGLEPFRHVAFEPHAIWAVDAADRLAGLWLCRISSDPTSKRFLRWRRRAWAKVYRDQQKGRIPVGGLRTPLSSAENANRA